MLIKKKSSQNVPDDWNMYWRRCSRCGAKYHAADGGCHCDEQGK